MLSDDITIHYLRKKTFHYLKKKPSTIEGISPTRTRIAQAFEPFLPSDYAIDAELAIQFVE